MKLRSGGWRYLSQRLRRREGFAGAHDCALQDGSAIHHADLLATRHGRDPSWLFGCYGSRMKRAVRGVSGLLGAMLIVACGSKQGVEGTSCSASSDCAGNLECVANVCSDLEKLRAAAAAKAKEDAEAAAKLAAETRDAAAKKAEERQAYQDELRRLDSERQRLDSELAAITDEADIARKLAELSQLNAQYEATLRAGKKVDKVEVDPLAGL